MSRIVVKNLPKKVSDDDLREFFSPKGAITDVQRKFKDGVFRRFAFIGFKTETEAQNAMTYFNNTFFGSSKIQIEVCSVVGDVNKPRAWSKYSKESSSYVKEESTTDGEKLEKEKKIKKKKKEKLVKDEEFEKLKKDPKFAEFLDVNTKNKQKSMCANDTGYLIGTKDETMLEDEDEDEDENEDEEMAENEESVEEKPKKLSDLEYLQSKMVGKTKKEAVKGDDKFTIVIRNLPYKIKKGEIKNFLLPCKPKRVRIPPRMKGMAYAAFNTEEEMKQALYKAKSFLGGRKIEVTMFETKKTKPIAVVAKKAHWERAAKDLENEETIAESGRLFVRNLSYTLTEDDLRTFFSGHGPLTEVNLVIDKRTNVNKGIGFVTFVLPEHAAKAYSELDRQILQGRIIHILPSKPKAEEEEESEHKSFKEKKQAKLKSQSGNAHNWNSLFLGADAVANTMVERYNTPKNEILNPNNKDSVAVRLALGETQLVNETRKFLERNGVDLEAFEANSSLERSKTSMLVKNLPSGVSTDELNTLFARHGSLKRIVQPPYGITAIVEFLAPSHARNAFKSLAYSKFHGVPLYLEWAPVGTFNKEAEKEAEKETEKEANEEENVNDDDDEEPEEDTTLFVKNLNFTTTDEILKRHMSKCGRLHSATVSRKREKGELLSLGFGFVQFKTKSDANKALEQLQNSKLDGHAIQLKRSNKTLKSSSPTARKTTQKTKQKSNKILVRNIPFQAHKSEVEKLFSTFGVLTSVRLPSKQFSDHHRGFGFIEFASRPDAKRAFDALSSSTHLYGRRLVLEWALDEGGAEGSAQELRRKTVHQFQPSSKKRKMEEVLDEMRTWSHEDDTFA